MSIVNQLFFTYFQKVFNKLRFSISDTARLFFYIAIFCLPFRFCTLLYSDTSYELGFFNEYSAFFLYVSEILFLLALFFYGIAVWRGKLKLNFSSFNELSLPFVILLGISAGIIPFAHDPILALLFFFRTATFVFVLILLVNGFLKQTMILRILFVSLAFNAILASVQFLTSGNIGLIFLGESIFGPQTFNIGKILIQDGAVFIRGMGTLAHANILGGILVLVLLMLYAFPLQNNSLNSDVAKLPYWRVVNYFLSFILVLGLFFTFSRAALLALICGVSVLLFVSFKKIFASLLFFVLTFSAMIFLFQAPFFARINTSHYPDIRKISESNRVQQIQRSVKLVSIYPFGVGRGSYLFALDAFQPGLEKYELQPVHNFFVLKLVEEGIFVLVAWIFFFGFCAWHFWRMKNFPGVALIVALFVLANFDHYLADSFAGEGMMFVALGLVSRISHCERTSIQRRSLFKT